MKSIATLQHEINQKYETINDLFDKGQIEACLPIQSEIDSLQTEIKDLEEVDFHYGSYESRFENWYAQANE